MKISLRWTLLLSVLLPLGKALAADALPAANKIDWTFAGVPGGIPNRTAVCATLTPGASVAAIQSAINSCPAGQVIFLSAGTYTLAGPINIDKDNVTLRGAVDSAGWPTTILQFSSGADGWGLIDISKAGYPANNWASNPSRNVVGGLAQGSTSITLNTAPTGLQVGQVFVLDQLDDENLVRNTTSSQGGGIWGRNSNRMLQQFLRVRAISGTRVDFEPPIYSGLFRASQSPQIYWFGSGTSQVVKLSGIENLKLVRSTGGGGTQNVAIGPADSVWVKNVWSVQAKDAHVRTGFVLNGEIRDSYFTRHDSVASASYAVWISFSSSMLIENNVMYNVPCALGMMGTAGSAFAYNFGTLFPYVQANWLPETVMTCHGGHCSHNLFEGNFVPSIWADFYHGNSSNVSIVRNRLTGWEPNKTGSTQPMNADEYQYNFAALGNVLGTSGYHQNYEGGNSFSIWNFSALISRPTLVRKGNWNSVNSAIPPSESLGVDTVSTSYLHASKPSWFGSLPWPPVDASNASGAVPASIPAGYRYQFNSNPPPGAVLPAPTNLRLM